jgi:hypothetical protein
MLAILGFAIMQKENRSYASGHATFWNNIRGLFERFPRMLKKTWEKWRQRTLTPSTPTVPSSSGCTPRRRCSPCGERRRSLAHSLSLSLSLSLSSLAAKSGEGSRPEGTKGASTLIGPPVSPTLAGIAYKRLTHTRAPRRFIPGSHRRRTRGIHCRGELEGPFLSLPLARFLSPPLSLSLSLSLSLALSFSLLYTSVRGTRCKAARRSCVSRPRLEPDVLASRNRGSLGDTFRAAICCRLGFFSSRGRDRAKEQEWERGRES